MSIGRVPEENRYDGIYNCANGKTAQNQFYVHWPNPLAFFVRLLQKMKRIFGLIYIQIRLIQQNHPTDEQIFDSRLRSL